MGNAQGLYDPRFEHDACGIGFVAHVEGKRSHRVLDMALEALRNRRRRGDRMEPPQTLLVERPAIDQRRELALRLREQLEHRDRLLRLDRAAAEPRRHGRPLAARRLAR